MKHGTSTPSRLRRGVALVEAAVVVPAFLLVVLGMLDFGLATLNRNNLSFAATRLCRAAIVRGEKSAPERTPWGPAAYIGTAAGADEIASVIRPHLAVMSPAQVRIRLEWLDGSNARDQRVRATVEYEQTWICGGLFGMAPSTQQAVSVMPIQH